MASTESGRQMYPSFKEAHESFVAEYTALYQGFPKYLEGLQHLTYPELVSWDFEGFTDIPELIQHAHLDNISF